ncbi:MAG TPA: GNAT family N-acetyltransferase [Solirubrobacteraceae bacterium]|nr:GNAT family N-acetyltransferase [Solirubrobacteraceae bacterium]
MIVRPAAELDRVALLELFNASYSDYLVPMRMRAADLEEHLDLNGIDLRASRVVHGEGPAAFALVGRRDDRAWIGGMGTHPDHRRRGLGEAALRAAVTAARGEGCGEVRLEVVEGNDRAIALYAKLGFTRVRELVVAQLDPGDGSSTPVAAGGTVMQVGDRDAERWVTGHREGPEPWQRAGAVLERLRERGTALRGIALRRDGTTAAAAVLRDQDEITGVLQIAAEDAVAAAGLLRAAVRPERPVRLVNVPDGDPAAAALQRLGAHIVARQYEMRLTEPPAT